MRTNVRHLAALMAAVALAFVVGPAPGAELWVDGQRRPDTGAELTWTLDVEHAMTFHDADEQGEPKGWVVSTFVVTAQQDMRLEVRTSPIFDDRGAEHPLPPKDEWTYYIGGMGGSVRRLVAGIPTLVSVCHMVPEHRELPTFVRMKFWSNDREVELRGVKTRTKAEWKQLEAGLGRQRSDARAGAEDASL